MHQSIGRQGFNRTYSILRKQDAIHYWKLSGGRVYYNNVREHEMLQWDALMKAHGPDGLRLGYGTSMEHLRAAPPPNLHIRGEFHRGSSGRAARVKSVIDALGQPIETPLALTQQERLLYHVVRELTLTQGICTYADLAHALWPPDFALPDFKIIIVLACHVNKKLAPERLNNVFGRGYRWLPN
jgi:hypothetical protein